MEPLKLAPRAGGWVHADWGTGHCWVRFQPDADGKLQLTEVHTAEPDRLRAIPIGRIRAACTMRGAGGIVLALAMAINEELPQSALSERPTDGWTPERYILKRPEGKFLADSFFADVAHAYQSCVLAGLPPIKTIAADVGVQLSTVAAWVKKARRLNYLPPGESGRAGEITRMEDVT